MDVSLMILEVSPELGTAGLEFPFMPLVRGIYSLQTRRV
jgi:hypothetical protein